MNSANIASRADFSQIRYAQCWEDADILLEALDIQPGDTCLSIASAGDNTLAMLTKQPARVIAVDLNPAQLACLELRIAAYRVLEHHELLELIGSRPSNRRLTLYARCRSELADAARRFWDAQPALISAGIGAAGKFEHYLALFRTRILPLVHSTRTIADVLRSRPFDERQQFYQQRWDGLRWQLLYRCFFSRTVMGRVGRDPRFFDYVEGSVAERLLARTRYALTVLDPSVNPYLTWILTGRHGAALPYALREEHFATIRANLDRLELRCSSVEEVIETMPPASIDRFNLSDMFEYMSPAAYQQLLSRLVQAAAPEARLAYWNMLAPRSRPTTMAAQISSLESLSQQLFAADKAFFYSAFVVEQVATLMDMRSVRAAAGAWFRL